MPALQTLLRESIDYAGLFPPAGLGMREAAANYGSYRDGPHAWALGRFVVPASRLEELEALLPRGGEPWRLAALLGAEPEADLKAVGAFNTRGAAVVDVVEAKADSPSSVERLLARVPPQLQMYVEIPVVADPGPLAAAVKARGGRLKVRTGGITADAFPAADRLVRFLRAAHDARVAFKATAGLHHPLRAEYRLTYEAGSACGTMFGFLNLFLAAAFLGDGLEDADAERLLEERDPDTLRFDADGVEWRGQWLGLDALRRARESSIVSFGSCSFTEPIGDLQSLGLL